VADEILHSSLESDIRQASMISREVNVLLTHNASIRRTGYIPYKGDVAGTGSDKIRVRQVGLGGADSFVSATEIETLANTALTDSSYTLAVTRYGLIRSVSDLARMTAYGTGDPADPFVLANDYVNSFEELFNSLVATAGATASSNVGTSGVDMSADDAYDAVYTLEIAGVPGPWFAVLDPRQTADLQESLRGESGPSQFMMATQEMLNMKGQGFVGRWLNVDWFHDPNITEAGGNSEGFMAGLGAITYATGSPLPIITGNTVIAPAGSPVVVEMVRVGASAETKPVGHAYVAVSLAEQARIVGIVTDAP
jgi:hypothetical protein